MKHLHVAQHATSDDMHDGGRGYRRHEADVTDLYCVTILHIKLHRQSSLQIATHHGSSALQSRHENECSTFRLCGDLLQLLMGTNSHVMQASLPMRTYLSRRLVWEHPLPLCIHEDQGGLIQGLLLAIGLE